MEAIKCINLFHKSFYEFHENRIKKEEASADADLDSDGSKINGILSKIVGKIGSLIRKKKKRMTRQGTIFK